MDKQKIIKVLADAIREYEHKLWGGVEFYDLDSENYKSFAENFKSIECAKICANALFPHAESLDDLAEIKSALGLPDDTPEPLVGVIWRLQQRIEILEDWIRDA